MHTFSPVHADVKENNTTSADANNSPLCLHSKYLWQVINQLFGWTAANLASCSGLQ